jgi:hypothetical protein
MEVKVQELKKKSGSDIVFIYFPQEVKDRFQLKKGDILNIQVKCESLSLTKK